MAKKVIIVLLAVFAIVATHTAQRKICRPENIIIEKYEPKRHERGIKAIFQYHVAIGSPLYIKNIKMVESLNSLQDSLKILVARKKPYKTILGCSWIVIDADLPQYRPQVHVHGAYDPTNITTALLQKIREPLTPKKPPTITTSKPQDSYYVAYQLHKLPAEEHASTQQALQDKNSLVLHMGSCDALVDGILVLATYQHLIARKKRLIACADILRSIRRLYHTTALSIILQLIYNMRYKHVISLKTCKKEFAFFAWYTLYCAAEQLVYRAAKQAELWLKDRDNGFNLLKNGETFAQYAQRVNMTEQDKKRCAGKDALVNYTLNNMLWERTSAYTKGARRAYVHPRCT